MGIKINNLPKFEEPSDNNLKQNNILSEEFYEEINRNLPLIPSFPRDVTITRIMCDMEAKRILTNLNKMNDEEVFVHCDQDLLSKVLQSLDLPYKIVDIFYLPKEEKTNVIKDTIQLVRDYYKNNMNGETLYNATKLQGISISDSNNDLEIEYPDLPEELLDDNVDDSMIDLLIMSGASREFADRFLTSSIGSEDFLDFTKMQFLEALNSDKYIKILHEINHKFYGDNILGQKCLHPLQFDNTNKFLIVSISEIDEETGDITIQFFDENEYLVDYEDLLESLGQVFKNWLDRWKISVEADVFILHYKYANILEERKSDPISDLASKNINIVYKSVWFDIALRDEILSQQEKIFNEIHQMFDSLLENAKDQPVQEVNNNPLFDILNRITPPKDYELTTAVTTANKGNEDGYLNLDLILLGDLNEVGSIRYTSQPKLGNTLYKQFIEEIKTIDDVFEKIEIILPKGTENIGFPWAKERAAGINIIRDNTNYLLVECSFIDLEVKNNTTINPILGIIIKNKNKWQLFFPKYGNSYCINADKNKIFLDRNISIGGVLAHADLMLRTDKEFPFNLKSLGLFKNYISSDRYECDDICYYKIGKLFFNDSKAANDFKSVNDINTNQIPIYLKIKGMDEDMYQNIVRYFFAVNLNKSDTIQNARLVYNNNKAYLDLEWDSFYDFIGKYKREDQ